jgi:hypothetical protein
MAKKEMVEAHVEKLLKRITGNDDLKRDADGDWPFDLNRAFMYVRVSGDTGPTVRVVGVAAHSVPEGPDVFGQLNEINNSIEFSRAFWQNGTVFVTTELVGESLDIEELQMALNRVASGADYFGPKVVEMCGGETPTPESPPPSNISEPVVGSSGYL